MSFCMTQLQSFPLIAILGIFGHVCSLPVCLFSCVMFTVPGLLVARFFPLRVTSKLVEMVAYVASVSKNLAKGTKLGGELPTSPRLRAVSLFLESPWETTQNKYAYERDCERDVGAAMPRAASSVSGIAAPTSRLQSRSHAYFFCVLSRKRETARSLHFSPIFCSPQACSFVRPLFRSLVRSPPGKGKETERERSPYLVPFHLKRLTSLPLWMLSPLVATM